MRKVQLVTALLIVALGCQSDPVVVVKEVPVQVVVTATPVPVPQATYTPYPTATPQSETTPTPRPTAIPATPVPTPTPVSNDYYVLVEGRGIEYWADFPSRNYYGALVGTRVSGIENENLFIDYL